MWGYLGVPAIDARALAIVRTLVGTAFLLILIDRPIRTISPEVQHAYSPLVDTEWVRSVAASPRATATLQVVGCAAALLFALGVLARPAYVGLVSVLLTRAMVLLLRGGVHDWGLPLVTLLALLIVPWHHGPPVWRLRRQAHGEGAGHRISRAYGFAVWLPGLTLGLAFAAAAYAKLHRNGLAWITDGAVRYHFVEDGLNAPVTLGLWVATQPAVAVALSLAAVFVEALFILVIFARRWEARAAFGLVGFGLMAGFWVFQGVHWWAWLLLFVAFLPWNRQETVGVGGRGDLTLARISSPPAWISPTAWKPRADARSCSR